MEGTSDRTTRILIADDNRDTCRYIVQHLRMERDLPLEVAVAYDRDEALDLIHSAAPPYDIVIADLWMPDSENVRDTSSGLKILEASRAASPATEVLIITGNSSADTALRASLTGAREYILKPIDYERLVKIVREIVSERELSLPDPEMPSETDDGRPPILGASRAMIDVMKTVGRIAPTEADVLIEGESGVGKDLIARTIHANSPRAQNRFVVVNCSAISGSLIEAELFGIGRRVATEVDAREGKFMEADGGTLFLDEVGEMTLDVQPKLLRAIEQKEVQRVGGRLLECNVRIVAATNRNLEQAVREGSFRKDLFYRLSAVRIRIPSLSERREDIPLLAEYFLRRHVARLRKRILGFGEQVVSWLVTRPWPGNIRELENAIETAVLRCSGALLRVEDFPEALRHEAPASVPSGAEEDALLREVATLPLAEATEEFERRLIGYVLRETGGNVTRAAKRLGIGRTGLHRKMRQLGITRSEDGIRGE